MLSESAKGSAEEIHGAGSSHLSIKQSNQLQKQSSRWLNLSKTLRYLLLEDTFYATAEDDNSGLSSFFDVMEWRVTGKVTETEFTFLYSEWMKQNGSLSRSDTDQFKTKSRPPDIHSIRQILLDRSCTEKDLTRFVGLLLHENNLNLINIPISYTMRDCPIRNHSNLELCNESWLTLCESLFFSIDILGHGYIKFDEISFFCGCIAIGYYSSGSLNLDDIPELELTALTATAIQFIRDANDDETEGFSDKRDRSTSSISLPCFKRYLLEKGIGLTALGALLQNVRLCIRVLTRVLYAAGDSDSLQSCLSVPLSKQQEMVIASLSASSTEGTSKPLVSAGMSIKESSRDLHLGTPTASVSPNRPGGSGISGTTVRMSGPPNLWQRAVIIAAGYDENAVGNVLGSGSAHDRIAVTSPRGAGGSGVGIRGGGAPRGRSNGKNVPPPPIVLFLLSDAEEILKGSLRAIPHLGQSPPSEEILSPYDRFRGPSSVSPISPFSRPSYFDMKMNATSSGDFLVSDPLSKIPDGASLSVLTDAELHFAAFEIWLNFQDWGLNAHKARKNAYSRRECQILEQSSGSGLNSNSDDRTSDGFSPMKSQNERNGRRINSSSSGKEGQPLYLAVRKDPLYSLVMAAILEYKALQGRMSQAMMITARHISKKTLLSVSAIDYPNSISLRVACTALRADGSYLTERLLRRDKRTVDDFKGLEISFRQSEDGGNTGEGGSADIVLSASINNSSSRNIDTNTNSSSSAPSTALPPTSTSPLPGTITTLSCSEPSDLNPLPTPKPIVDPTVGSAYDFLQLASSMQDILAIPTVVPVPPPPAAVNTAPIAVFTPLNPLVLFGQKEELEKANAEMAQAVAARSALLGKLLSSSDLLEQMRALSELRGLESPATVPQSARDSLVTIPASGHSARGGSSSAGNSKYTETLMEILRQMPSEQNSKDHLKSLQRVLKLGYDIAQKENLQKIKRDEEEEKVKEKEKEKEIEFEIENNYVESAFKKKLDCQLIDIYTTMDDTADMKIYHNEMHSGSSENKNFSPVHSVKRTSERSPTVKIDIGMGKSDLVSDDSPSFGRGYSNETRRIPEPFPRIPDPSHRYIVSSPAEGNGNRLKTITEYNTGAKSSSTSVSASGRGSPNAHVVSKGPQAASTAPHKYSSEYDSESDTEYSETLQSLSNSTRPNPQGLQSPDSVGRGRGRDGREDPLDFFAGRNEQRRRIEPYHTGHGKSGAQHSTRTAEPANQSYFVRTFSKDSSSSGARNQNPPPSIISDLDDLTDVSISPFPFSGGDGSDGRSGPIRTASPSLANRKGRDRDRGRGAAASAGSFFDGRGTFQGNIIQLDRSRNIPATSPRLTRTFNNLSSMLPMKVPGTIPSENRKSSKKVFGHYLQ